MSRAKKARKAESAGSCPAPGPSPWRAFLDGSLNSLGSGIETVQVILAFVPANGRGKLARALSQKDTVADVQAQLISSYCLGGTYVEEEWDDGIVLEPAACMLLKSSARTPGQNSVRGGGLLRFKTRTDAGVLRLKGIPCNANRTIVLAAVRSTPPEHAYDYTMAGMLDGVDKKLLADPDIMLAALERIAARPPRKTDKVVFRLNEFLEFCEAVPCSPKLMDDPSFVLAAEKVGNGSVLLAASERVKDDRSVALACVASYGDALASLSPALQQDRQIVLSAVKNCGFAYAFASEELRKDREIAMTAAMAGMTQPYFVLSKTPQAFLGDLEFIQTVLAHAPALDEDYAYDDDEEWDEDGEWQLLSIIPEPIRSNFDVVMAAIKHYPGALRSAPNALRNNKAVVLEAVGRPKFGNVLQWASDGLRGDREVVLLAMKNDDNRCALQFASEDLLGDHEIALEALRSNKNNDGRWDPIPFHLLDDSLLKNAAFLVAAMEIDPCETEDAIATRHLSKYYGTLDPGFPTTDFLIGCLKSKILEPRDIESMLDTFCNYFYVEIEEKEIFLALVESGYSHLAVMYAAYHLLSDHALTLMALKAYGPHLLTLKMPDGTLALPENDNRAFMLKAIKQDKSAFMYASKELQRHPEIRKAAGKRVLKV
eukprot:g2893.t1